MRKASSEALNVIRNALNERAQLARRNVLTKPGSETGLIEVTTRKREDRGDDLFFWCFDEEAVQTEEDIHGLEGDALVAIHEGVVA